MTVKALRRQLMAAIAMVVVSVVALSSSTYAWFVNNNSVKAGTITATATTSNNLTISNASDGTFSSSMQFNANAPTAFAPVSAGITLITGIQGTEEDGKFYKVRNWETATENAPTNGAIANDYIAAVAGTDYSVDTMYFKSTGADMDIYLNGETKIIASGILKVVNNYYRVEAEFIPGNSIVYSTYGPEISEEGAKNSTTSVSLADGTDGFTDLKTRLENALGSLRVALVDNTGVSDGDSGRNYAATVIMTTATTEPEDAGYYNTATSYGSAVNITGRKTITSATETSVGSNIYKASIDNDVSVPFESKTGTGSGADFNKGSASEVFSVKADTVHSVSVYVYLEGCDKQCVLDIADGITYSVSLGFSGVTPSP